MSNSAGRTMYLSSRAAVHHCTGLHCHHDEDDDDHHDDHDEHDDQHHPHHHDERWQKSGKQFIRNSVHISCLVLLLPIIIIDKTTIKPGDSDGDGMLKHIGRKVRDCLWGTVYHSLWPAVLQCAWPATVQHSQWTGEEQAQKARWCDIYLQSHPLTHWPTDWQG